MPRQQRAAIDRHLQPLVRIERDRIGPRDRLELPGIGRIERRPGAEGAVDVQPDAEFSRDVGDRIQRVDGAGVGRAAAGDDRKGQVPRLQVVFDGTAERIGPHAKIRIGRDCAREIRADAELLDALLDRGVAFGARVEDELLPPALEAFGAHVPARPCGGAVARSAERIEGRRGAAAQQQALAAFDRESDQLHDPAAETHHQEDGGVVVAVEPAVHRGRDGVGQDRDRRRRRIDPGIGPPVPDRDGPGHDFAPEEIQDLLRRLPSHRQRQGHEALADLGRHDAIDRLRRQVAQVLADHHGDTRAEAVEFRPVLGEGMHGLLGHRLAAWRGFRRHTTRRAIGRIAPPGVMPMRRGPAVFFALGLAVATAAMAHEPPSRPGIDAPELAKLGPFGVGMRTIALVDDPARRRARIRSGNERRSESRDRASVELWYPAVVAAGASPETYSGSLTAEPPAPPTRFTRPGIAVRDAKAATGRFPLVIVSHGYDNDAVLLSWLTENLASKGYVVAAIRHADPPITDRSRFPELLLRRPLDIAFVRDSCTPRSPAALASMRRASR